MTDENDFLYWLHHINVKYKGFQTCFSYLYSPASPPVTREALPGMALLNPKSERFGNFLEADTVHFLRV